MTQQKIKKTEKKNIKKIENLNIDTNDTSANSNTSKIIRARLWFFTFNNYEKNDLEKLLNFCKCECIDWNFQEETGENGTPHLQGVIEFANARTFDSLKNKFKAIHWEKAKNKKAAIQYCLKEETRTGEQFTKTKKIKDPLDGKDLKWWQIEVMDLMKTEPDDRKIYWYYDLKGGCGKTSLAKSLCIRYPNQILYIGGKTADIKYGVKTFLENTQNELKMCIFDFVRTCENFISYDGIESIKNGIFYNTKYESGMVIYDIPHIIIFANFEPDKKKLSEDRWNIINLNEELGDLSEIDDLNTLI